MEDLNWMLGDEKYGVRDKKCPGLVLFEISNRLDITE